MVSGRSRILQSARGDGRARIARPSVRSPHPASHAARAARRPRLGRRTGADVLAQAREPAAAPGSFKLRGAAARLPRGRSTAGPPKRVVAASAGNHGLGVARSRRGRFGSRRTVLSRRRRRGQARGHRQPRRQGRGRRAHLRRGEAERAPRAAADPDLRLRSAFDDDHVIAGTAGCSRGEMLGPAPRRAGPSSAPGGRRLAGGSASRSSPRHQDSWAPHPETNCAMRRSLDRGPAAYTHVRRARCHALARGTRGAPR
jgi:threonine dehydratase